MSARSYRLYHYSLPLKRPLSLRGETLDRRCGVLIQLTDVRGHDGWGDAAPLPGFSAESLEEVEESIRQLGSAWVRREDCGAIEEMMLDIGLISPSARYAFSLARMNYAASVRGISLLELLAPGVSASVPINGLFAPSGQSSEEEVARLKMADYKTVKIKVGAGSLREDIDRCAFVRDAMGEVCAIRLDANRAWDVETAMRFADEVRPLNIEYIEEPLADPELLQSYARESGLAIALDETVPGLSPGALVDHGYARAVILKPSFLGDIARVLAFGRAAMRLGMTPVISSVYESGVGVLGLLALSAALTADTVSIGLDPYTWLADDVLENGIPLLHGKISISHLHHATPSVKVAQLKECRVLI